MVTPLLFALVVAGAEPSPQRAECLQLHEPKPGEPGRDVLWEPTPDIAIARMLALADVQAGDLVVDLGAGDGRVAIAAARDAGARALGIEFNPALVAVARCLARVDGVDGRVTFVEGDVFTTDFSGATVVMTYLLPEMNLCLRPRLLGMPPGTRIAAHRFAMADWPPDTVAQAGTHSVFLWTVPARVEATWTLHATTGETWRIRLRQSFQQVEGDVVGARLALPLRDVVLRGAELRFTLPASSPGAGARTFVGRVDGLALRGTLSDGDNDVVITGKATSAPRAGAWASLAPLCSRLLSRGSAP